MAASWQDRDGAKTALLSAYMVTPIRHVFADQGFTGRLVDWTRDTLRTIRQCVATAQRRLRLSVGGSHGWEPPGRTGADETGPSQLATRCPLFGTSGRESSLRTVTECKANLRSGPAFGR
ncbi:hypothetical protein [Micromonospora sp. NPDC005299]|uniref:hypothetical protein n=1 Tax=Micromonospora sp. NPDC005299 TaxID=3364231 RepID=UPI0036CDCA1E